MTLDEVPVGSTVRLTESSSHPSSRRLAELGLRPGGEFAVLRRCSGGGRILAIGSSRMAVDKATMHTLGVEAVS